MLSSIFFFFEEERLEGKRNDIFLVSTRIRIVYVVTKSFELLKSNTVWM